MYAIHSFSDYFVTRSYGCHSDFALELLRLMACYSPATNKIYTNIFFSTLLSLPHTRMLRNPPPDWKKNSIFLKKNTPTRPLEPSSPDGTCTNCWRRELGNPGFNWRSYQWQVVKQVLSTRALMNPVPHTSSPSPISRDFSRINILSFPRSFNKKMATETPWG